MTKLSEFLALEKAGKFEEALKQIQAISGIASGDFSVNSLNLKLMEQRLYARIQKNQAKKRNESVEPAAELAQENRLQNAKKSTWSAIITMWKRKDYLAEQLAAIRAQSIPPQEIIILINENHISDSKIRDITGPDIQIIRSDINSLYSRWAVAYIAKGEYISVFDDDIVPGKHWIANAIRACSSYNALVGPAGRIYNKNGLYDYYKLVVPSADIHNQNAISCSETDIYCDWVCNSYLFKREWVGHALSSLRYKDSFKTFDDIQLATSLYLSGGIRCVTPMQPSFDKELHGSLQHHYGNDSHAIWKTNSDQHFAGRKAYIEELVQSGYVPVQQRDGLYRFHLIVPFGERNMLERCLLTIKGQDYQNFTCTLIDDCCDGSDALKLVKHIGLDKFNIRYIKTKNKAYPLRARELATDLLGANLADVIVHLDGDDWFPYPDVLSRLNRIYRKAGIYATYGNALCIRNLATRNFSEFSQFDMSRKWNVAQRALEAKIMPFRKIKESELANGWKDAPWCGMHLRTFQFSKWLGLNRESFRDKKGQYLKVGTDAAIFIPILDSCRYESIDFIPDLAYVYQNAANTIHAKKEITSEQKNEALTAVANADQSINHQIIKQALIYGKNSVPVDDSEVFFDTLNNNISRLKYFSCISDMDVKKCQKTKSSIVTIVTPNYLADAIICLMSYRRNLKEHCDIFVFVATEKESEITDCMTLLADSKIFVLFPNTLRYAQNESRALAGKYKLDTDEYRWAMKAVMLLELLHSGYSLALFLDPDIYTVSDITDVHQILAHHPISVFPHFRDPDHEYLRGVLYKDGFFNGGMLAATPSGIPHLVRLYERCLIELKKDPARHRWDDQKYFDLFALEVKNLYVNLDRGIDYNPWNYEPVEGLVAPSQRSVLLKSGFFVRHWHVSTMLIKNSIELKEIKFSVYRFIVSVYLQSLMYTIILIVLRAKSKGVEFNVDQFGLEIRFNNIADKLSQISSEIPITDIKNLFANVNYSSSINFDYNLFLGKWVDFVIKSICFDNNSLFADILLMFFPSDDNVFKLADELRKHDLRFVADEIIGSHHLTPEDLGKLDGYGAGDLIKNRLLTLQSCNINY